jgi:hypothetical protein
MNKLILSAACVAMAFGLATAATTASAAAGDRNAETMSADANKDGMVSKDEFLAAMGKMYDAKMAAMKKMSAADQAKMIKGDQMTMDGYRALVREFSSTH